MKTIYKTEYDGHLEMWCVINTESGETVKMFSIQQDAVDYTDKLNKESKL